MRDLIERLRKARDTADSATGHLLHDAEGEIVSLRQKLADARAKLREWAGECAECDGTGRREKPMNHRTGPDPGFEDCPECADIREAAG